MDILTFENLAENQHRCPLSRPITALPHPMPMVVSGQPNHRFQLGLRPPPSPITTRSAMRSPRDALVNPTCGPFSKVATPALSAARTDSGLCFAKGGEGSRLPRQPVLRQFRVRLKARSFQRNSSTRTANSEHHEEATKRALPPSHAVDCFFQNVDAIIGPPEEPVISGASDDKTLDL